VAGVATAGDVVDGEDGLVGEAVGEGEGELGAVVWINSEDTTSVTKSEDAE
jgi:hypothetical protein